MKPKWTATCVIGFSLLAVCAHAADTLAERFQNLPAPARGPGAILRIDTLDADTALRRMNQLADMGFGGVLLSLSTADDTTWDKLGKLMSRATELRLELGIQDFLLSADETARPGGTLDAFNEKALSQHINKILSELQTRFSKHYGTTLAWFLARSFPNTNPERPPDLDTLFFTRTGFRLTPFLPALEGNELEGDVTAAYVREQVSKITADTWRTRFAEPIRDLVQEAGLEAGILASESWVPPEEVALFFMRPVLLGCATSATERATNKRIAHGARTAARRTIMGHLPLARVQPVTVPTQFACKHEMDRLFIDGATRLLLDAGETAWQDETLFTDAAFACLYARRWQFVFNQSEPFEIPGITWQTNETGVAMVALGRKTNHERIYCIVNDSPNGGTVTGIFKEEATPPPEHWNPETGEVIQLESVEQTGDRQTAIRFFIEPYGAFFVVFR